MNSKHVIQAAQSVFTSDCVQSPYWLDGIATPGNVSELLLDQVDVAIVGSGYTGLHAAIETARAGYSTVVLDANDPGWGCSTRNGGQVSSSIKPSSKKLIKRHGRAKTQAIRHEDESALQWIGDFITTEALDCDFQRNGLFQAAHTPRHFDELLTDAETLRQEAGIDSFVVPRSEQRQELGSDCYHGGVVYPRHASLHPAKYQRGLLSVCQAAGTYVVGHCPVTTIKRDGKHFRLTTKKGSVLARNVVVATNGYTGRVSAWLQRRVIPIGSYVIATEPLPDQLIAELFPTNRIVCDTCKVVYYYRTSPDRKRVLFGGRVSANETDTRVSGPKLFADMCRTFPQLSAYKVSHSWMGRVAYTFDEMPHTGVHDGIHYAMGYCGSGVAMASYLGKRLGQKVLGMPEGMTAFDSLKNPTRPFYQTAQKTPSFRAGMDSARGEAALYT